MAALGAATDADALRFVVLLAVRDSLTQANPQGGAAENAPGRIRTCDLALRRRALYPLSYGRGEREVYRPRLPFSLVRP